MSRMNSTDIVTITGGTGSFGSTIVKQLLKGDISEIRILSRDENKQDSMRNEFKDPRLKFIIGDVRDFSSVDLAIKGADYVFHAAALKQVPSCEFFPMQAVATNVVGSSNVVESSLKNEVRSLVCLSTDKAVYPINAMGMSKALMEKVAQSYARNYSESNTKISITRYGNVMMSRGSVIPLMINQIRNHQPISITNPEMTRFMMTLSDSVDLVNHAFKNSDSGDLFVRKAPACSIDTLARAVVDVMGVGDNYPLHIIGTRHGEKLFETLLSTEEKAKAIDEGEYFRVPLDTRTLDYQVYFDQGKNDQPKIESYNSHNTKQLGVKEVVSLIKSLPEFSEITGNPQ
jgi:UDP-N-acetylglucosamine 4,6-dehydratase